MRLKIERARRRGLAERAEREQEGGEKIGQRTRTHAAIVGEKAAARQRRYRRRCAPASQLDREA